MSHKVTTKVEFKDPRAFRAAVEALGFEWLGQGSHRLYASSVGGLGFKPPGWRYPAILTPAGELACDDGSRYDTPFGVTFGHGKTFDANGKCPEFEALRAAYAVQAAKQAAESQGWYCEVQGDKLVIYHPDGGTLEVTSEGTVDAQNFHGVGCQAATDTISTAIGRPVDVTVKPEYFSEFVQVAESAG